MELLLKKLLEIPEAASLAEAVEKGGCPAAVTGLSSVHKAQIAAALAHGTNRSLVMVCADEAEAGRLAGDLETLLGVPALRLYARELFVRTGAVASRQWEMARIGALYEMAQGQGRLLVCTAEGLLQKTAPAQRLRDSAITLEVGGRWDLSDLTLRLASAGYSRCDQVEGVGQFALRGGILDVFSPLMEEPVRCEFFDDEIDSLGSFDTTTQRRTANLPSALLLPAAEQLPDTEMVSAFGCLPADALICLCETGRITERVKGVLFQAKEDTESLLAAGEPNGDLVSLLLSQSEWLSELERFPVCMMEALPTSRYPLNPRTPPHHQRQAAERLRRQSGRRRRGPGALPLRGLWCAAAVRQRP